MARQTGKPHDSDSIPVGANRIADLKAVALENLRGIDEDADVITKRAKMSVDRAINAGGALKQIKDGLPHGEWGKWLKSNIPGNQRTVERYIEYWVHRDQIRLVSNLTEAKKALDKIKAHRLEPETAANDVGAVPILQTSDVMLLGDHVLVAGGDSTDGFHTLLALDWGHPAAVITDPPYGIDYKDGAILNDHIADWRAAWRHFEGNRGFIFHAGTRADAVIAGLKAVRFEIRHQIIWQKPAAMSHGPVRYTHEPIYFVARKGSAVQWRADQIESILRYNVSRRERKETDHQTPKPVALIEKLIDCVTEPGDFVYDPFGGSGSTLIAAENGGRRCLMIEKEPRFCDQIVRRWQKHTGRDAVLYQGNRPPIPFAQLEADQAEHGPRQRWKPHRAFPIPTSPRPHRR